MNRYFITIYFKNSETNPPIDIPDVTMINSGSKYYLMVDTDDLQYLFKHSEILGYSVSVEKGTVE